MVDIYTGKNMHCKYFATSNPSDMDDLAMTCIGFGDFPKMLICYEKHPVSRAKKVVIERLPTIDSFSEEEFSTNFNI